MSQILLRAAKTYRAHPIRFPKPLREIAMVIKPHLNGDAKHAPLRLLNQQLGGLP